MSDAPQNDLAKAFFAHEGKLIDKWEQYLGVYQAELGGLLKRDAPLDLLEIGVQNGGSLEMWAKLLPAGSTITGLDIDARVADLVFDHPIKTHIVDATNPAQVEAALGEASYDIIIDDGSHICTDVIAALNQFYPRLRLGGLMFIEDLHTSYNALHGGGYRKPEASIEYLKQVVDLLHLDYLPFEQAQILDASLPATMRETLGSLAFYDSLVVLRKLAARKERPWRRLISGDASQIVPFDDWIGYVPSAALGDLVFGELAARSFETAFLNACGDHVRNDQLAVALRAKYAAAQALLAKADSCVANLLGEIATLRSDAAHEAVRLAALSHEIKTLLEDDAS